MMNRVAALLLLVVCLGTVSQAQEVYDGLDIVFLVDQSGSMGGRNYGHRESGAGTDPLGLRFEGVQYALDTLGQYRLTLAQDVSIRMAVVNFGDAASQEDIQSGWIPIAESGEPADWDMLRGALSDQLSDEVFKTKNPALNLGNTNFAAAFDAAITLFNQSPSDGGKRLRVVILLTDGAPCVPKEFDCSDVNAQRRHMEDVTATALHNFPSPDYLIYVLALDDVGGLWER